MSHEQRNEGSEIPFTQKDVEDWMFELSFAMRMKIEQNKHKGKPIIPVDRCIERLKEEVLELKEAVKNEEHPGKIKGEMADVAWFAFFTYLNYVGRF
jgi:NTP pyrophosphatase (non-canonical NTP hydrolase)